MSSGHSLRWCEKYSQSHVACSSKDWLQLLLFSIARDCVRLGRPRFPALQAVCLFFSPDWLFRIFFFLLIGHCDYYDFGHSVEESALMYTKLQCH